MGVNRQPGRDSDLPNAQRRVSGHGTINAVRRRQEFPALVDSELQPECAAQPYAVMVAQVGY